MPEPLGYRPALILARADALPRLLWATVAPLTRTIRGLQSEVGLDPSQDLVPSPWVISMDNIATVAQDLLVRHIGPLSGEWLNEAREALHFVFDLPY